MIIASNDLALNEAFGDTQKFVIEASNTDVDSLESVEDKLILVSDRNCNHNQIIEFSGQNPNNLYFYMISNENYKATMVSTLKAHNIEVIPPKMTVEQIVNLVINKVYKTTLASDKIVCFFGADSDVGVTMLTDCLAQYISENSEARVLNLKANYQKSDYYTNAHKNHAIGLEHLRVKIANNILSYDEFVDACHCVDDTYHILYGVGDLMTFREFNVEIVSELINIVNDYYDLIIIDAGTNLDCPLAVSSLRSSDFNFLITTQGRIALENFKLVKNQWLNRLDINDFNLVVNKAKNNSYLQTPLEVANDYGYDYSCSIAYSEHGEQAEQDGRTLLSFNDDDFNTSLGMLSSIVCSHYGIDIESEVETKTGIFQKMFNKS